jgi:type II secretory pathway component PulF
MITLGVATVVEIAAYLIPWLDNLLDSIALPLAAIAGTAVMVSTVADLSPAITWALAIIAGGGTATAVKASTSTTRLASTATTAGFANPIVSTIETGTSVIMSTISIFAPILAILFVLIILWLIFKFYKIFRKTA